MLFAFEGPDGSGKSTLIEMVEEMLETEFYRDFKNQISIAKHIESLRTPSDETTTGKMLRKWLTNEGADFWAGIHPQAAAAMFASDMRELATLYNNFQDGIYLIDRWTVSTLVYQSAHLIINKSKQSALADIEWDQAQLESAVNSANDAITTVCDGTTRPDMIFIICPSDEILDKRISSRQDANHHDKDNLLQALVRESYRAASSGSMKSVINIDNGIEPPEHYARIITNKIIAMVKAFDKK